MSPRFACVSDDNGYIDIALHATRLSIGEARKLIVELTEATDDAERWQRQHDQWTQEWGK